MHSSSSLAGPWGAPVLTERIFSKDFSVFNQKRTGFKAQNGFQAKKTEFKPKRVQKGRKGVCSPKGFSSQETGFKRRNRFFGQTDAKGRSVVSITACVFIRISTVSLRKRQGRRPKSNQAAKSPTTRPNLR